MTISVLRLSTLLLIKMLFIQSVMADEPEAAIHSTAPSWVSVSTLSIEYDSDDPGQSPDFAVNTQAIYSSGSESSPMIFTCAVYSDSDYRLYASIQLNPGDPVHNDIKRFSNGRFRRARIEIDSEKFLTMLIYRPRSNMVHVSPLTSTATKLYNAVLENSQARLLMGSKSYIINLPPKDEVFTDFATSCPVTNGGSVERWNSEVMKKAPIQLQAR